MDMGNLHAPFRYDYVGSFLRPQKLKEARASLAAGTISRDELTAVENSAIEELVGKQKAAGYHVITDGEFRRQAWHLDFMWGFDGVGHQPTRTGLPFAGEQAMIDDTYLTGKISVGHHPFVDHFRFVQQFEDENTVAKQTIPAPAQFLAQMAMPFAWENTQKYYDTPEALARDIAEGYRKVIREFYDAGCRNLQFDDCTWGMLVDPNALSFFGTDAAGLDKVKELYLEVNNAALEGRPSDLTVTTHVCRGNYHSTFASRGAYNNIAAYLFAKENVDAFYLEYDDERSGSFDPLALVPEGKKVVLGLITTKRPELEDPEAVKARIRKASALIPLDRLCLSPQCGFASCEIGNKLTEEQEWAKLRLVRDIARDVWKEL